MHKYITVGMQYGDEGKGSFVDYLAHFEEVDTIVRYNGGCHASHTVITPNGELHKFSQLGSGMFRENCHTYLTENMVVNLQSLFCEAQCFASQIKIPLRDILKRIHIHENCYVVTPYHKLLNMLRELSLGKNRRGTVGTGVSEVRRVLMETCENPDMEPLGLQIKDIFCVGNLKIITRKFILLQKYVKEFYRKNYSAIWANVPEDMESTFGRAVTTLINSSACVEAASYIDKFACEEENNLYFLGCIYSSNTEFIHNVKGRNENDNKRYNEDENNDIENGNDKHIDSNNTQNNKIIFEGAQGFLIDYKYGTKPNTTFLDTTINFACKLCIPEDTIHKIGIAKAFCSRHGMGVFPTEVKSMSRIISDENQMTSYWNGRIRFGWFDAVLLRYAQKVNKVDEMYLSSLDKLSKFKRIKVCNEYIYTGQVDFEFEQTFRYYINSKNKVVITDIKMPSDNLGKYLEDCTPVYIYVKGWNSDISACTKKEELPIDCIKYIRVLENVTSVRVSVISVGPTRGNKIRM